MRDLEAQLQLERARTLTLTSEIEHLKSLFGVVQAVNKDLLETIRGACKKDDSGDIYVSLTAKQKAAADEAAQEEAFVKTLKAYMQAGARTPGKGSPST
jgi:hypothetical protein